MKLLDTIGILVGITKQRLYTTTLFGEDESQRNILTPRAKYRYRRRSTLGESVPPEERVGQRYFAETVARLGDGD